MFLLYNLSGAEEIDLSGNRNVRFFVDAMAIFVK
jgi:hypothetical protein